jgi:hypothetical protein
VDDTRVQAYIDDALASSHGNIEQAFQDLQARRNRSENCGDLNLAAAEHYMFARHLVADTAEPYPIVVAMILAYSLVKLMHLAPEAGVCPLTPTSSAQVSWALSGATDGMADYYTPHGP